MTKELVIRNLCKTYLSGGVELAVIRDLSFELSRGESLAVTGPSGVGKSTLLQILGTLDEPTSGDMILMGINPFSLDTRKQSEFRNRQIGFIFQDHHLLPSLTALDNVLLPALAIGSSTTSQYERAVYLLNAVGLKERSEHLPAQLSGGEKQRVAIARSLLLSPTMILADEPTGNLDPATAKKIGELLLELQMVENNLMIVVTHSQELASTMGQRLVLS